MFSCLTPVVFCWKMSESWPEWNVVSFGSCSRITLWCCTAKIMHNNNHIYTYIRSQGDNLLTPQISKQAIFHNCKLQPKRVWKFACSLTTNWAWLSKYGTLIMQSNTWRQTATNKVVVSSPVHPSGNTGHVTNKYSCKTKYFATFILHDRSRLNLGL